MYCYTHVNQFTCIFNELQLWTRISSEHPIFLKTVANLANIKLPKPVEDNLDNIHKMFLRLYNNVLCVKKDVSMNPTLCAKHITNVRRLIDEFLLHDTHALSFYPQLLKFGSQNKVWQELIKHIISEQNFMFELFKDLRHQI